MRLTVSPHSMVDVITNSSTTIYTYAAGNAVELVKSIINEVLQKSGSDKTADDLYSVKVRFAESVYETAVDGLVDSDPEDFDGDKALAMMIRAYGDANNYEARRAICNKATDYIKDNCSDEEVKKLYESAYHYGSDYGPQTVIVVESLDGSPSVIDVALMNMFNHEASYEG